MILLTESQYNSLIEAFQTQHLKDRISLRIHKLDLESWEANLIMKQIDKISDTVFEDGKSYAIKIHEFEVDGSNPNAIKDDYQGIEYDIYRIKDEEGKDSSGDEVWVKVKDNNMITLMFVKSYYDKGDLRNFFRVDKILDWTWL